MQKELDLVLKKLAEKYGRSVLEIEAIVKAPYYLVTKVMEKGDRKEGVFFNVRVRGMGIFKVCDRVLAKLEKLRKAHPEYMEYDYKEALEGYRRKEALKKLKKQLKHAKHDSGADSTAAVPAPGHPEQDCQEKYSLPD